MVQHALGPLSKGLVRCLPNMSTQTTVEIDVLLEFRDYLRANYWFIFRRFKLFLGLVFFAGVVYPLLVLSGIMSQRETDSYWGFLIPLGMLIFCLEEPISVQRNTWRVIKH